MMFPAFQEILYASFQPSESGLASGMRSFLVSASLVISPLMGAVIGWTSVYTYSVFFGVLPLLALAPLLRRLTRS